MHYRVTAKFHKEQLAEFFQKLNDGTIKNQKPDGLEILNSMKRAIIKEDKSLEWFETCFCATPLKHERETVYDTYFYDFKTTLVEENQELKGELFWDYMEAQ